MRSHRLERTMLALVACLPLAAVAGADEAPQAGVWQKHEYYLSYNGFTSLYSCDGIADKLKLLLLAAGARDDAKVVGSCTSPVGGPSRISTARATFYTLVPEAAAAHEPAAGAAPAASPEPAPGIWKPVEFRDGAPRWLDGGDCELVDQFDRELLPLFTTRNHQTHMSCVPHEYQLASISVRFETFAPLPKPRTEAKAAPQ